MYFKFLKLFRICVKPFVTFTECLLFVKHCGFHSVESRQGFLAIVGRPFPPQVHRLSGDPGAGLQGAQGFVGT